MSDDDRRPADEHHREPVRPPASEPIRQWIRRVPAIVWWITALHLSVLVGYSVLFPTYRSPDEPLHVDLAHLFSEELQYPAWDDRNTGSGIQRSLGWMEFHSLSQNLTAEEAPPKDQRPAIEDLENPPISTGLNQQPQHPPLYYVLAGGTERIAETITGDHRPDFQLETWFYRMVSVLFVAPLPLIVWRLSTTLALPTGIGVAATLVPLAIPQYLHIGSSANNDTLAFVLFWLVTPVAVRMAGGQLALRTAALAGLLIGLGLLTKVYAFLAAAWVMGALGLALLRLGRSALRAVMSAAAVFGAVALAVGGWWWVRNLVLYGEAKPSVYRRIVGDVADPQPDALLWIRRWARSSTQAFWGDFGWFDVAISGTVVAIATGIVLACLVLLCVRRDRVAGVPVGTRLLLAAPVLLLTVGHFGWGLRNHLESGRYGAFQGRYWFGALAAVSVVVAWSFGSLMRKRLHLVPLIALVGVIIMQTVAFFTVTDFYWGPPDGSLLDRVRAMVAWAPMQGELLAVGGALGAVAAIGAVSSVGLLALRPQSSSPDADALATPDR